MDKEFKATKPNRLKPGDKVAIIAPASPIDGAQLKCGLDILRQHKLVYELGKNIQNLGSKGMKSADVFQRVEELQWAIHEPGIKAIFAATGGTGCLDLLEFLNEEDYLAIRRQRKVFMGSSDLTILNNALLKKAGLVTFDGPLIQIRLDTEEHKSFDSQALGDAISMLMSPSDWASRPFRRNPQIIRRVYSDPKHPSVQGHALGGNLSTFQCLIGSEFMPELNGAILFLEDVNEGGYGLSQKLNHLKLVGILNTAAGVVFGEFSKPPQDTEPGEPSIEKVIVDTFKFGPPCLFGFNFSHGKTQAVIPIGAKTIVNTENATVRFEYPLAR